MPQIDDMPANTKLSNVTIFPRNNINDINIIIVIRIINITGY